MKTEFSALPRVLRRLRAEAGQSQVQVADAIEVTGKMISKYEQGLSLPPLPTLSRILSHFGVSLSELERMLAEASGRRVSDPAVERLEAKVDALAELVVARGIVDSPAGKRKPRRKS